MKKQLVSLLLLLPVLLSFAWHKYYLSVTELEYNEEAQSVQMITRLFYDDLEDVLQERYDDTILVDKREDQKKLDNYIARYLKKKLVITINGEQRSLSFVGKELEDEYVVCYSEVEGVTNVKTLEIDNTLLMDVFTEQKNMVHTDILGKKKSVICIEGNAKALLNFSK